MTSPNPPTINPGERASIGRVIKDQRKAIVVALGLAIAVYWVAGQLDKWTLAGCIAGGIGLGLVNHLATEYWLLRIITSGEQPTRNEMIFATVARLTVLTAVAVTIAALMVSRVPYRRFHRAYLMGRRPFSQLIALLLLLAVFSLVKAPILFLLVIWYALSGPIFLLARFARGPGHLTRAEPSQTQEAHSERRHA